MDSEADLEFRAHLRAWLESRLPLPVLADDEDDRLDQLRHWQRELFDAGFGVGSMAFPVMYGGRGATPILDVILLEELGRVGAPVAFNYSYIARILYEHGTPEQRERYLQRALRGDDQWCQGFSEPDAGSDLAGIRTRAELDGDSYVVTGQKVWTSRAHRADLCLMLVRTGAADSRHRGITCLVVPLATDGITVRPFRQITGALEFAEVFLDNVRVPVSNRIGEENGGWHVAMSTVAYERGPSDIGTIAELTRTHAHLIETLRRRGAVASDPLVLAAAQLRVDLDVLLAHVHRSLRQRDAGEGDANASSVDKLLVSETEQRLARLELEVGGPAALLGARLSPESFSYLGSRAVSVYGGTSQIQLNIVATRLLGLPRV